MVTCNQIHGEVAKGGDCQRGRNAPHLEMMVYNFINPQTQMHSDLAIYDIQVSVSRRQRKEE